ncbi:ALF repeat-containing protein, partial [Cellulomonas septica]|nr:hypothetical protein [Cellulomonas septica]
MAICSTPAFVGRCRPQFATVRQRAGRDVLPTDGGDQALAATAAQVGGRTCRPAGRDEAADLAHCTCHPRRPRKVVDDRLALARILASNPGPALYAATQKALAGTAQEAHEFL